MPKRWKISVEEVGIGQYGFEWSTFLHTDQGKIQFPSGLGQSHEPIEPRPDAVLASQAPTLKAQRDALVDALQRIADMDPDEVFNNYNELRAFEEAHRIATGALATYWREWDA